MRSLLVLVSLLLTSISIVNCSKFTSKGERHISSFGDRGYAWEYDPGAPKDSKWPDLFAETPNFRAFGKAVLQGTGEKFRWIFGPMWYRGRLGKNEVKVFVIGQEGAQDENVSNRSFTGSTGTRMQKFLNYLGIDRSYLFMNTFVYTITGQYSLFGEDAKNPKKVEELKRLMWLAQDESSIVVQHRHKMFDYMLEQNEETLSLVIGVGTAGKDSAATWVRSHGGKCSSSQLSRGYCTGTGKLKNVRIIGVSHPGAASARNGGDDAGARLRIDFNKKAQIVADLIKNKEIKLETDPDMKRDFTKDFRYGYAAIPHRDFAFGTPWVMGNEGTTSNRRGQNSIQVYSENGCYNNTQRIDGRCKEETVHRLTYSDPPSLLNSAPSDMDKKDFPNESPRSVNGRRLYDEGPGQYGKMLIDYFQQPYSSLGVTAHESFGPNGIYRGRFDNASVLILADQQSFDDMFSGRALTGAGGQYLQSFLNAMGATKSYFILRSLPVDTMDLSEAEKMSVALNPGVFDSRDEIIQSVLKNGKTQVVLTLGEVSKAIAEKIKWGSLSVVHLTAPEKGHEKQWNSALAEVKKLNLDLDSKPSSSYSGSVSIIPREDLPAYTRWWMGTSGSRAARAQETISGKKVYNGDYYRVIAPRWASSWRTSVKDLNAEELKSLEKFNKSEL
ncbi:MAG: hypothetical protein COW00_17605 [Bdellovibrio sp. CG12_big_fil_rev_8_21_14_0_65_39_13]|nr:MAG: hypothetical protein COW78_06730 [Bdellovibrio sp. CG22_combo_CG10-13_8_21_14_all_39_27]PIQ58094.1 MAG: hypothetical protein COW00_17605 [Bdellovibrio sp. CG12_big_fil_rev_8_21_14_0_65_39_13]PIR32969.1 MAG: hypothetical protein COV37_17900 [Bdellovibrio sp. CG11_big_fil_rev_8_21_14_0_20_39_38]